MAEFKVSARIMLELGSELISSDIIAFFELIKNSFDARTENGVDIRFEIVLGQTEYFRLNRYLADEKSSFGEAAEKLRSAINSDAKRLYSEATSIINNATNKTELLSALNAIYKSNRIRVIDTGTGMSIEDLTDVFLVVGTASRKQAVDEAQRDKETATPFLGEKGIGRLSAMRLGHKLSVQTTREQDTHINRLNINWNDFDRHDVMLSDIDIEPYVGREKPEGVKSGTRMIISDLTSNWTKERLTRMAISEFSLLTNPLANRRSRKRISLSWNGERVSIPLLDKEFLKHAHAKIKGRYEFEESKDGSGTLTPTLSYEIFINDLGFEHPKEIEPIKYQETDLISMVVGKNSDIDQEALRAVGPFNFELYWFNRRRLKGIEGIGDLTEIRKVQKQWTGIRLYRDDFRVYPYGAENDDWLELDRRALASSGYLLNKTQFIGQVNISRMQNPLLLDQTNREGLRETAEQKVLLETLQYAIQDDLRQAMRRMDAKHKKPRIDVKENKEQIGELAKRAKKALKSLKRTASPEEQEIISDLQFTVEAVTDIAQRARAKIDEVEQDSRKMIDMAGIGLLVEIVAHELARVSENALDNLNEIDATEDVSDDVNDRLNALRASMKSINKRLRVLDPLSVSGRQRAEKFSVVKVVNDILEGHAAKFERHNVKPLTVFPDSDVKIRAVKGMVVQVLENLMSNSLHWMALEKDKNPSFVPVLTIRIEEDPAVIYFEDNGPGIAPRLKDKVFELFYSLKDRKARRGLGLYIARDCAEHNGGSLELDEDYLSPTGRLNRFEYRINKRD